MESFGEKRGRKRGGEKNGEGSGMMGVRKTKLYAEKINIIPITLFAS